MDNLIGKKCWIFGDGVDSDTNTVFAVTVQAIESPTVVDIQYPTGYRDLAYVDDLLFTPADVRLEYARRVAELGRKAAEFDNSLEQNEAVAKAA